MSITRDRFLGGGRYLALTSTHKLTYGLARAWNLSAAASGKSVTLDDARRVGLGFGQYTLHNSGSNAIAVKDSAGTTLFSLAAGKVATLGLVTNSTAAGKWKWFLGDAGSSRTFSRPTRDAVANSSVGSTSEPNCADTTPCGTMPCFQHYGDFSTWRECVGDTFGDYLEGGGASTDVGAFMFDLYDGRGVAAAGAVSGPWMAATFGIDPTVCAPGGSWGPDANGLSWTWAYTGSPTSDVDSNPGIEVMLL